MTALPPAIPLPSPTTDDKASSSTISANEKDDETPIKTTSLVITPPTTTVSEKPTTTTTTTPTTAGGGTPKKKKKKTVLSSLFLACIPCISSNTHDDPPPSVTKPLPPPSTTTTPIISEKPSTPATPTPTTVVTPSTPSPSPSPSPPTTTIDPPTDPSLLANTSPLPLSNTEGVTSASVVPPGSSPPPPPLTKTKRRKNAKHSQQAVDQSIITSVPEPGFIPSSSSSSGSRGGKGKESGDEADLEESSTSDSDEEAGSESEEEEEDEELGLIARGGVGIPVGEDGLPRPLLNPLTTELKGRKCLVLDLDETLVHSSFKMVHQADYVVPVEIENQYHNVYVIKRPGVDGFLKAMGEIYEVVIFTASLSKYADPVLDQLDIHRVVQHRLFRESCYNNKGSYVKDLSQLGRPMSECIIIDNSPASYVFHPNNAVPISSWFNDPHDTELTDLVPFLADLERVDDVRGVLDAGLYSHSA